MIKRGFWIMPLLIMVVLSSCVCADNNDISDINNSGCTVKYGDKIYSYYAGGYEEQFGLYEYDISNDTSVKLDDIGLFFSPIYIIDEKLYYAFSDDSNEFALYSIDLNDTSGGAKEEAVVEDDMSVVTAGDRGEEFGVFRHGDLYVFVNSNVYRINDGGYELAASGIASVCAAEDEIYYSKTDGSGTIYSYNGISGSVLLDGEALREKDDYVRVILGGTPNPFYIRRAGERVYFIASTLPGSLGRVYSFDVSDPEDTLTQMTKDSATHSYKVYNEVPYFIFDGKLCCFEDGQQIDTGFKNITFFNIIDDDIYMLQGTGGDSLALSRVPCAGGMKDILMPHGYNKLEVLASGEDVRVVLNGVLAPFPDAEPFVDENNRTQIPVRALAELLDFNVSWNGDTLTAELTKDDTVVTIKIGENQITKNGETIEMDTAAKVVNDRTYIPLRFVGEALGCNVEWEN